MKRGLIFLCIIFLHVASYGATQQDYSSLWKKVNENISNDLPRNAIAVLHQISAKAQKEGRYGQMLAAELKKAQQMTEISPDSLEPAVSRLKAKINADVDADFDADFDADVNIDARHYTMNAVLYTVLGGINCESITSADRQLYFDKALLHPDILETISVEEYSPLTEAENNNSTLYTLRPTLLDAIAHEAKRYQWLSDYYEAKGNHEKACVELYFAIKKNTVSRSYDYSSEKKYRDRILAVIKKYENIEESSLLAYLYYQSILHDDDVSEKTRYDFLAEWIERWPNSEVAKSFRGFMQKLTQPSFTLALTHQNSDYNAGNYIIPGKESPLYLMRMRNVSKINISITPLNADGSLKYTTCLTKEEDIEKYRKLANGIMPTILTYTNRITDGWERAVLSTDSMKLPKLPVGVYLIEATAEPTTGKVDKTMTRAAVLFVSDIRILSIRESKTRLRLISVSATTGKPIPNTTIRLIKKGWKNGKPAEIYRQEFITDAKGEYSFNYPTSRDKDTTGCFTPNIIYAYNDTDKSFKEQSFSSSFWNNASHQEKDIPTIFTDRSIYRPGQKIQGTIVLHNNKDIYNIHAVAGRKIKIELDDADYQLAHEDCITTDSLGHASFTFSIPTGKKNGSWSIRVNGANMVTGSSTIHVEEYKRPTFEIISPKLEQCYYVNTNVDDNADDKIYKLNSTLPVVIKARTFTDVPVQNATVTYTINRSQSWCRWWLNRAKSRTMAMDTIKTDADGSINIPLSLSLPERSSGRYNFAVAIKVTNTSGETHETTLNIPVCSSDLKAPEKHELKPEEQEAFFDISANTFPNLKSRNSFQKPVVFRMGSTEKDIRAYYSLISERGIVESGSVDFSRQIISRTFKYDESYGEGLSLYYIWTKDGKIHSYSTTILKPQPDLSLKTRWVTFRDLTQPGTEERWTLKVENEKLKKDITQCGVFSVYDKSLDQIVKHHWAFAPLSGYYYSQRSDWNVTIQYATLFGSLANTNLSPAGVLPEAAGFNHSYYPERILQTAIGCFNVLESSAPRRMLKSKTTAIGSFNLDSVDAVSNTGYSSAKASEEDSSVPADITTSIVRKDFSETAFFSPSLLADKNGNISLEFTLPEAMTSWRLLGFVHDSGMRYCLLDTTCIAQKYLMVQPNMPRFIREGDNACISATISNMTNKGISLKAVMQIMTPGTENVVLQQSDDVTLSAKGQMSVTFNIDTSQLSGDTLYTVRIAAISDRCSDGEQHNLAILPAREHITNTEPLTFFGPGTYKVNADSLWLKGSTCRQLVEEYTDNPAWLMIESLPSVSEKVSQDAVSTMTAIYAGSISDAIKSNVNSAESKDITNYSSLITHLRELQLYDGSWPWWEGMQGSYYVTAAVTQMIARQMVILGSISDDLKEMLSKSLTYMGKKAEEEVVELKKQEKKGYKNIHPSEMTTEYLYITALLKNSSFSLSSSSTLFPTHSTLTYLVNLLSKVPTDFTILGKARAAVIFSAYGKTQKAKEYLESIRQYSVYTPLAGRYYDTGKAYYSWRNYRIPTEVAAIEAISTVMPTDTKTVAEMQQWLLHEKRTTQWDTPLNTVDAVYAFLRPANASTQSSERKAGAKVQGLPLNTNMLVAHKNYRRDTLDVNLNHEVVINKSTTGTSWGAIYASQLAPLSEIDSASSDITVKREVLSDDKKNTFRVGDKVKVRITVIADRDYDFVTITDNRPACIEPVETTSGYRWGYFLEIKDQCTKFHVSSLSKGKHVFETSYYIDRNGEYTSGTCTATCSFAPEFTGRAKAMLMKIEK